MKTDLENRLRSAAAAMSTSAFLAEVDKAGACLTLHVRARTDKNQVLRQLLAATAAAGVTIDIRIRAHAVRDIAAPRSIEHWLREFASGTVIFDPTLVAQRARTVLDVARACRQEFGRRVSGLYLDANRRTLYVVMPSAHGAARALEYQQRILAVRAGVAGRDTSTDDEDGRWEFTVRVASKIPDGELTPVDAASASLLRRLVRIVRRGLVPGAIALAVAALALPAAANSQRSAKALSAGGQVSAATTDSASRYGMLWSLSVFSDGENRGGFAATGLASFFGEDGNQMSGPSAYTAQGPVENQAPNQPRRRRFEIRDITNPDSESGPSGSGPGS